MPCQSAEPRCGLLYRRDAGRLSGSRFCFQAASGGGFLDRAAGVPVKSRPSHPVTFKVRSEPQNTYQGTIQKTNQEQKIHRITISASLHFIRLYQRSGFALSCNPDSGNAMQRTSMAMLKASHQRCDGCNGVPALRYFGLVSICRTDWREPANSFINPN